MDNSILAAGIRLIAFLQNLGGWLEAPMQFFTFLGTENFFLFVAPAVYWCVSPALGLRLGVLLLSSGCLNDILKVAFHAPRPFWVSTEVKALSVESSFGIPSGHAQHAAVIWGALAAWLRRGWAWAALILLIVLIGLSRLYLGVHFPTDVLAGWLVGALYLALALRFERPLLAWLGRRSPAAGLALALGAPLLLLASGLAVRLALASWTLPPSWMELAAQALPGQELDSPLSPDGILSYSGALAGMIAGGMWVAAHGGFSAAGPVWKRLFRFVVGLLGVFVLWYGLGEIFPRDATLLAGLLRFLRYALLGLWITAFGPWVFRRLRLAEPSPRRPASLAEAGV